MELSLGRHADYAIRATLDLARHYGRGLRKAREISDATQVPATYLPQIMAQLVRAGIATSTAGPRGGYGLASPPAHISIFQVVTAVDGDVYDSVCVLRGTSCDGAPECTIHTTWIEAQHALTERLSATSFAQLASEEHGVSTPPLTDLPGGGHRPDAPADMARA